MTNRLPRICAWCDPDWATKCGLHQPCAQHAHLAGTPVLDPEHRAGLVLAPLIKPVMDGVREKLPPGTHFSIIVAAQEGAGIRPIGVHTDREKMLPVIGHFFLHAFQPTRETPALGLPTRPWDLESVGTAGARAGVWERSLVRAFAACGDGRQAANELAEELMQVLGMEHDKAYIAAWRLLREHVPVILPLPADGCLEGREVDWSQVQTWDCPVHPGYATEPERTTCEGQPRDLVICWGHRTPRDGGR